MALDRETLEATLDALHEFATHHLSNERLLELDAADEFPEETVRRMQGPELGIQLLFLPEEYNGMGGGAFEIYRLCEEMARLDVGVATGVLATFLGSDPISVGGTPEQKTQWLTRIADEGILMAYGATEPQAGSDLGALKTTATPIEENGEVVAYKLDGRKQWISNGGVADVTTILANAPGGPSWFIVEKGTEGFSHGKPEDKHGIRASNTAALWLDDVRVGVDRLVGGVEGQGLAQAQAVFGYTRLMVAAFGLGAGWSALDKATAYSVDRIQAGGPLSEKQGYTHKLIVPFAARLEAARAYIEETAQRLDSSEGTLMTEGAIAKYLATETGNAAAEAAIQALGGYGYTKEYLVEKIKRDVRITTIYEGTSEIMEMTIGRDRWQMNIKSRGRFYEDQARELAAMSGRHPRIGADIAALALRALGVVFERCRTARLTRNQHVLFRLGELVAYAEAAAAMARRAASAAEDTLDPLAHRRFDASAIACMSRIFAREAALKVATDGIRWVRGASGVDEQDLAAFAAELGMPAIQKVQNGLIADMNHTANELYSREDEEDEAAAE